MAVKKTVAEMEQALPDSEARKRLIALFDEDSFVETDKFVTSDGAAVGVITGYGLVDGVTVYAVSQDISVKGGAVCKAASAKINKLYQLAVKNGAPVVTIYDSKGGDIAEGISLLNAYGEIASASAQLSGVVPQIAYVAGLCGGMAAMTACMADFVVMNEKSEFFMTAPFVAEDGKTAGAGTAANAAASGTAAIVAKDDSDAIEKIKMIVRILPSNNLEPAGNNYYSDNDAAFAPSLKGMDAISALADTNSAVELYSAFGSASAVALGSANWRTVGFVATNKTGDKLSAADCAKIARFVSFCDAFSIPVITILDTEGFGGSVASELAGSVRDCAKLAQVYASATTAKITLVTGKAYGSAFAAFAGTSAVSDFTIASENAVIAPASPKAASIFLNNSDSADSVEEYIAENASAFCAAGAGMVDRVVEDDGIKFAAMSALDMISGKRVASPARKHINFVY